MKYYKVKNVTGWEDYYKQDHIYPGDYYTEGSTIEEDATGVFEKDFKVVSKTAYDKQEGIVPKPRVKKVVVSPSEFKIGDKVEFIDCAGRDNDGGLYYKWARNLCTKGECYSVQWVADNGNISIEDSGLVLNKLQFKLSTQTKLTQTEMENYSIEGSKALKTAFAEECGLKLNTSNTISDYKYYTSEDKPVGTVQGTGIEKEQHFVLPKDWEKAVKYVTEFNTPKVVFKTGDIVVLLDTKGGTSNKVGDVGAIIEINHGEPPIKVQVPDGNTTSIYSYKESLRLATPAEVKAYKAATELKFKMAGYDSKINKSAKTISFGCQTYTKAEVKLLLDAANLCNRVGYSAKVKASGFVVNETDILTPDSLTKILAQLK